MNANNDAKFALWMDKYIEAGFADIRAAESVEIDGTDVLMSHFPYDGDSHGEDRYSQDRLKDIGMPLIHGHTHSSGSPVSLSKRGSLQIHVGQDAWDFTPVSIDLVARLLKEQ
jgi:calcineurin-like phosphoesterase family protein